MRGGGIDVVEDSSRIYHSASFVAGKLNDFFSEDTPFKYPEALEANIINDGASNSTTVAINPPTP